MSRVIKFRAWDTKRESMYSAEELGRDEMQINPDGRGFFNASAQDQRFSQYYPHLLPLQFTGLHDKNGVEIYEGDIVKKLYTSGRPMFVVAWHNERMTFIQQDGYNEPLYEAPANYIEVVGNIYEHKHLLEDANTK